MDKQEKTMRTILWLIVGISVIEIVITILDLLKWKERQYAAEAKAREKKRIAQEKEREARRKERKSVEKNARIEKAGADGVIARQHDADTILGKNVSGVRINNISVHTQERMVSCGLASDDIIDSLDRPLTITYPIRDNNGRLSMKVIGERSTVVINPENGTVITVHKTHSKLIRKLKCSNGTDKP